MNYKVGLNKNKRKRARMYKDRLNGMSFSELGRKYKMTSQGARWSIMQHEEEKS